ncbi:TPA: ChbG/HpnK family deacetylase [Legionella pneumophila subsp. pneumophila]|uniref:ChbG/HpnK family deacetylase n=1 Tax=Legionella pneumophila (strain Lens) TaxID=297245 RepID=Q5WTX3_LEGPL|nr:ChbG/HpnK family deacetylase [Legionella pneumophila]AOW51043.1 cellobiose phosphorylase [Legionella pneumophila subsp. pneumophila]AOW55356.1 cellobiose phosphorylase [Legionella pneumophila subsp. pneumophila]AOW64550.1 cellobiose phosphorylase [Legionella pneumophila subsp. pneumophila]RYW82862.1 ChbG/HpnK family deacetylase [Legionella pneumophila]RYW91483.1 ChbG/HpnK family deacetylase [Legionella pneumophila]
MSDLKNIFLCADDFGLNHGITQGILKMARLQRLSAVSCIVNASFFDVDAPDLLALKNGVRTGLHFNLTEGYFLSHPDKLCFGLRELLIRSHLGILNSRLISDELNTQLDHFIKVMGKLPDFIDGHQHIHQFPGIRRIIIDMYEQRLKGKSIFIRSTYPSVNMSGYQAKTKILGITGGKILSSQLKKTNIPHNPYFAGIYDFSDRTNYRSLFRQWLNNVPTNTLIMCHPGECENSDIIAAARARELNYFLSDEFMQDCEEYQVNLTTGPKS